MAAAHVTSNHVRDSRPTGRMAPRPKSVPSRLGPPPQLSQLHNMKQHHGAPPVMMQRKFQPKMREIMARQAKLGRSKRSLDAHQSLTHFQAK